MCGVCGVCVVCGVCDVWCVMCGVCVVCVCVCDVCMCVCTQRNEDEKTVVCQHLWLITMHHSLSAMRSLATEAILGMCAVCETNSLVCSHPPATGSQTCCRLAYKGRGKVERDRRVEGAGEGREKGERKRAENIC